MSVAFKISGTWVPSAVNDFYMLAKQPADKQMAYTTIKCLRIVFKLESGTAWACTAQTII
jgi:hypothetical protein